MAPSSTPRLLTCALGTIGLCAGSYLVLFGLAYVAYVTFFADATVRQAAFWGGILVVTAYVAVAELRRPTRVLETLDTSPSNGQYPHLEAVLTRLAKAADVPAPTIWIAPVEEPHSLTTGRP